MKPKIAFVVSVLLLLSCKSYLQGAYYQITVPDTAYSGVDVLYQDGFHILGNAWRFNPPYSGIPIEGEYSFGNVYFFLDKDGQVEYKEYLDNNEISPSLEGHGRVPGAAFFSLKNEGIILPYTKHYGILPCTNPMLLQNTFRLGVAIVKKNGDEYIFKDSIYNENGFCENHSPIGYIEGNNGYLLILKDNIYTRAITFRWFDLQNKPIAEYQNVFSSFEAKAENIAIDGNGNPILLGWDTKNDYNMSLLKTNQQGDSLFQINTYSTTHPFTPIAISGGEEKDILIAAYRYSMDYSETEYFLLCFDQDLNEKWRMQFPYNINAIAALNNGEGYLIASKPLAGQPSPFNVSYLNGQGELVSSEEYGEEYDIPEKVKILNDSFYAVIGTKFIGYQNSTIGNPYASIFVFVDTVQNLTISNIREQITKNARIIVYPNPCRDRVELHHQPRPAAGCLYGAVQRYWATTKGAKGAGGVEHVANGGNANRDLFL